MFLTSEDDATDGAPTMLEPLPEADAIVSTGFFKNTTLGVPDAPAVERVIGLPYKAVAGDRRTGIGDSSWHITAGGAPSTMPAIITAMSAPTPAPRRA